MGKKISILFCTVLILCFALIGCGSPSDDSQGKSEEKLTSVIDQGGNEIQLPENISKIAIRVGTPMREKYLGKPVIGTVIEQNMNSSNVPAVRYMWGSQENR